MVLVVLQVDVEVAVLLVLVQLLVVTVLLVLVTVLEVLLVTVTVVLVLLVVVLVTLLLVLLVRVTLLLVLLVRVRVVRVLVVRVRVVTVSVLVVSVWVLLVLVTVELVDVVEFTSDVSLLLFQSLSFSSYCSRRFSSSTRSEFSARRKELISLCLGSVRQRARSMTLASRRSSIAHNASTTVFMAPWSPNRRAPRCGRVGTTRCGREAFSLLCYATDRLGRRWPLSQGRGVQG